MPAAIAREMLVQAAMNRIGDPTRANYTVANGVITHTPSGDDADLRPGGRRRRRC